MSKPKRDDWHKPRSNGQRLTADEIKKLQVAFRTGRRPDDIARELQCSSRVASKYYAQFRGKPHRVDKSEPEYRRLIHVPKTVQAPVPQSRFYKSSFEI